MPEEIPNDNFMRAAYQLERSLELKSKHAITEQEFDELRAIHISEMKQSASVGGKPELYQLRASDPQMASKIERLSTPATVHDRIMNEIKMADEYGTTPHIFRLLKEMEQQQTISALDNIRLQILVKTVDSELPAGSNSIEEPLIDALVTLHKNHRDIMEDTASSPVAKTISDITQQSAINAADEVRQYQKTQSQNKPSLIFLWKRWRGLVLPDVWGAIQGAGTAKAVNEIFSALPVKELAVVAALIAGSLASGKAWHDQKDQDQIQQSQVDATGSTDPKIG